MPRKIQADFTFDEMEDEVLYTRAAIGADPDARDLLPATDGWLPMVDAGRAADREARVAITEADAFRKVANERLDAACERFGLDLLVAVERKTSSTRFKQFFSIPVSRFVRQGLAAQVAKVRAWLTLDEPTLACHREALDTWSKAAADALEKTHATALLRGKARITRESLAEDLTRERDGLHAALVMLANERGLPRTWPDVFFRVESDRSSRRREASEPAEEAPADAER